MYLRQIGDSFCKLLWGICPEGLVLKDNFSRRRGNHPGNCFQKAAFAAPVGADDGGQAAFFKLHIDIFKDGLLSICNGNVLKAKIHRSPLLFPQQVQKEGRADKGKHNADR